MPAGSRRSRGALARNGARIGAWLALCLLTAAVAGAAPRSILAAPGARLVVQGTGVPLRAEPRADAPIVLRLGPEHRLVEFARREAWVKVGVFETVGAFGWLPADAVAAAPAAKLELAPEPAPAAAPPPGPDFLLRLTGSPALLFRARCRLIGGSGERTVEFEGTIPRSYRLEVDAVSCRVLKLDAFGRLRARLYQGDALIAAKLTSAPFNHVRVRSDGPWGAARSSRGATPLTARPTPPPPDPPTGIVVNKGG